MKKLYRKGTVHPSPPLISDHLSFLPPAILILAAALSQEEKEVLAYLISCSSGEFSGNRRTTHKSTTAKTAPTTSSSGGTKASAAGSGAEHVLSGNRKTINHKSTTPNSTSETDGGGSKGIAAASGGGGAEHVPSFNCYCFSCYMSYWVKWDSSPNRQLIHEILDAYEDGLQSKKEKSNKERRNKNRSSLNKNGSSNGGGDGSSELKKSFSELSLNKIGSESRESDQVEETFDSRGGGGYEEETGVGEGVEKGSVRKFVSFLGERIWSVWT